MQAYDVPIKRNDIFLFYFPKGKITLVTDPVHPASSGARLWSKGKGFGARGKFSMRIAISPTKMRQKDLDSFLDANIMAIVTSLDKNTIKTNNIFVAYKPVSKKFIEVGLFSYEGYGDTIFEKWNSIVNRYLRLKAFW